MLQLTKGARADERFHLQRGQPVARVKNILGVMKRVTWQPLVLPDGSAGTWTSWWVIGNVLHWYRGTCKCDGTRTQMYWAGQLDDGNGVPYVPDSTQYVMTTTPKEMTAVRLCVRPGNPTWDNMGGA